MLGILKRGSSYFTCVLLVGAFLFSFSISAAAKTYNWKIQSAFPRGDLAMSQLDYFAEKVAERSSGKIKLRVFAEPEVAAGSVLPEAVRSGVLQMMQIAPPPYVGSIPIGAAEFGLPFSYVLKEFPTYKEKANAIREFFYTSGMVELLREEYAKKGFYWLDMHIYGPGPFLLSRTPFKTFEDMEGKKIRAGGFWAKWFNLVGARGTAMPGSQVYMGLKLGTVDAAQWDASAVTGMKWHEVAPYWIRGAENDHLVGNICVNLKTWNKLPDDLKSSLHKAAEDLFHYNVDGYSKQLDTINALIEKGELKVTFMDDELLEKHKDAAQIIWKEFADNDPATAKAIDLIKKWRGLK